MAGCSSGTIKVHEVALHFSDKDGALVALTFDFG